MSKSTLHYKRNNVDLISRFTTKYKQQYFN